MTLHLNYNRNIVEREIRANCGPVTLTVDEMLYCLGAHSGLEDYKCKALIARKIYQAHDEALERTLFDPVIDEPVAVPTPVERKPLYNLAQFVQIKRGSHVGEYGKIMEVYRNGHHDFSYAVKLRTGPYKYTKGTVVIAEDQINLISEVPVQARYHHPSTTHYVSCNGAAVFCKEADFFISQGGLTDVWGETWQPVSVSRELSDIAGIEAARSIGVALFAEQLRRKY